jgi:uncharacterized protein (DUF983 family)
MAAPASAKEASAPADSQVCREVWPALRKGLRRRCPACGEGKIFWAYLKVNDNCPGCGEELHHHRADDAPPYLTIIIVGHIVVSLLLLTEEFCVPVATLAGLLHGAIETASLGLLPVYAVRTGETPETGALLVTLFALGNVVFQLPAGFASDRMERGKLLVWLAILSLCGAVAMALAGISRFFPFCALLVFWGGAVGSLYAVGLAHLGSRYNGADLASANAAFIILYSLGMLAGPPVVGLGMDLISPNGFFYSIAGLVAIYLGLVWGRGQFRATG